MTIILKNKKIRCEMITTSFNIELRKQIFNALNADVIEIVFLQMIMIDLQ